MARLTVQEVERIMADVPEDKVFRSCDGSIYRNMLELRNGLRDMSGETYACHVTADKNDFSNWLRHVIGDNKLANDVSRSANPVLAARRVDERLSFLQSKLG